MSEVAARRDELEAVIERGLQTFVEVGNAIREIRDSRLYKDEYGTFEEYCRGRWGWSRAHVYRQIEAADTAAIVSPIGDKPATESQARELAPLKSDPETMNRVWGGVVEEHGENPAAKHVKKAVQQALTAERIRIQLPDATRTIVEGIDPDDCNLPNDPKQLTHLLDVSHKHGDERTAETAERVGNGEFKSTFDACPEVKDAMRESTKPDWRKSYDNFELLLKRLHELSAGVDHAGGLEAIVGRWPESDQRAYRRQYRELGERVLRQVDNSETNRREVG